MYTPSRATIYELETFLPRAPGRGAQTIAIDVTAYGYPAGAEAVELLLGCQSWGDGGYAVAYDGLTAATDRIAAHPTALMRNAFTMTRARVELENSSFLLLIRPVEEPVKIIAVLKGYYTTP